PGTIDEVSIYNRALSPDEIVAIDQAGSACKCPLGDTPAGRPVVLVDGRFHSENAALVTNSAVIEIQTTLPDGHIFYTLDNSDPHGGLLYVAPFVIGQSAIMHAVAYSSDYAESAQAEAFSITVVSPPAISQQPLSQIVAAGSDATFNVLVGGNAP